jgi:hypothetical protein
MQITQHYCHSINDIENTDDASICESLFDANETMVSYPSTATIGRSLQVENDENHQPVNNNIVQGNEYTMLSDCKQWNTTVASCTKSMKDVSTMTLPPLSVISFESMCDLLTVASPPLSTPLKVFNSWTMEQKTRASSSGRKDQHWYEERNKSVHFASPLATKLKKKMTPAEKQEARDKARLWAESRHRSQSSMKISKKRQNTKLKRNQNNCIIFANAMSNEVRPSNPSVDISSDSIASRVKRHRRAKIRY